MPRNADLTDQLQTMDAAPANTPDERIDRAIELKGVLDQIAALDKLAKRLREQNDAAIIQDFITLGKSGDRRNGALVSLRTEYWPAIGGDPDAEPSDDAKEKLVAALKAYPGTAALIKETYNTQSLRSVMCSEFPRDGMGQPIIPDELSGVLRAAAITKVSVTKA